jgi:membrane protease YdiL (CAAX protease family)
MTAVPAEVQRSPAPAGRKVRRYFLLTFAISWTGALAVVAPHLLRGEAIPKFTGIMMFPAMLLGPAISGMIFSGRGELRLRFTRRFSARWLVVLLAPSALIATVLGVLFATVSRAYAPNHFVIGFSFGITAGFIEEIGWTGYAFPAMRQQMSGTRAALLLGLLWSLWHLPVVDYLGTVTPHGSSWLAYFLAFAAAMTAMRVIICRVFANTGSLLLAQLLHTFSTGSLVALSPPRVTGLQEAGWYFAYAAVLWFLVGIVSLFSRTGITRPEKEGEDAEPAPSAPGAHSTSGLFQ